MSGAKKRPPRRTARPTTRKRSGLDLAFRSPAPDEQRWVIWHFVLTVAATKNYLAEGRRFFDDVTHEPLFDVSAIRESMRRNRQVISHAR